MITGEVKPTRDAVIRISVRGPTGHEFQLDAVVDTRFLMERYHLGIDVIDGGRVEIRPLS